MIFLMFSAIPLVFMAVYGESRLIKRLINRIQKSGNQQFSIFSWEIICRFDLRVRIVNGLVSGNGMEAAAKMMKLIVNADDFGYSNGVNYGIIDCHKYGIVNSATMMMNMYGTSHAIQLAKENPALQMGVHLVLTCGKPLLADVPSLTDEQGFFKKRAYFKAQHELNLAEVEREWTAQIEKFLAAGLTISHLDSHHHVHQLKVLYPVIKKLALKYDLPVRQMESDSHFDGIKLYSDYFFSDFFGEGTQADFFERLTGKVEHGKTVEVMTHPAYLDHEIFNGSSYTHNRVKEAYLLTNIKLPKDIELLKKE